MDKREKKHKRTQEYFAETAKEMIIRDGIAGVSVRKVAEEAGYSLGTVYNHFKNLDDLLWLTRNFMIDDIAEYMERNCPDTVEYIDDVITIFRTFIQFFIDSPNIYEFIYFYRLDKCEKKIPSLSEKPEFSERFTPLISFLVNEDRGPEQVMVIIKTIIFTVNGLLTLYITGNDDMTEEIMFKELESTISLLV